MITLTVVFASLFRSKDGKTFTRLFVPIGGQVYGVVAQDDCTALAGHDVTFDLACRDGELRLYVHHDVV